MVGITGISGWFSLSTATSAIVANTRAGQVTQKFCFFARQTEHQRFSAPSRQAASPPSVQHFCLETLETRNSDGLDFHNIAVWSIRAALEAAFAAGQAATR